MNPKGVLKVKSEIGNPIASVEAPIKNRSIPKLTQVPARIEAFVGSRKVRRKVWIDIDNSPHVPLYIPIIHELERHGVELLLTARNMYQVCELLEYFKLSCKVIGGHWGKNNILKILNNCVRVAQLIPTVREAKPDLAISHGSRAQLLAAKVLGIPSIMMHDYEHNFKTGFVEAEWVLMPDVIPDGVMTKKSDRILRYPGLKEDVYIPRFHPDPSILTQLGIVPGDLVVTVRPPATEAHYHTHESDVLFAETMRLLSSHPHVRAVTLPRNARQSQQLKSEWKDLISAGSMIIPAAAVDGLNLMWFSDLVVSGGGTMNREAAALGVPVYSIFRGKIGAVDHYLAQQGRLTLLATTDDVRTKIKVARWNRPAHPEARNIPALQCIVNTIIAAMSGTLHPTEGASISGQNGASASAQK
jgi:predicted glycosyltransferase